MVNPDRVRKLISAMEAGDAKTVRLMLKGGVPANYFVSNGMGDDGSTLANMAAHCGQAEIFDLLISEGADINAREVCSWATGKSMLECACSARNVSMEIVGNILKSGQVQREDLSRALLVASYSNRELVRCLLDAGGDPNYIDKHLDTPLVIALTCGQEAIAIELLEAGADATVRVRNNVRSEFWKKSLVDVAKKQGMQQFLDRLAGAQQQAPATKTAKVPKPKTIEECWAAIDRWLTENLPNVKLPGPSEWTAKPGEQELLSQVAAEQIRQSMAVHDGTGEFALIPMSSDANYCLLSYADATTAKKMMQEVCESEFEPGAQLEWWSPTWWPIADNGGGDYLVLECEEGKWHSKILKFSHETRRATSCARSFLALLQGLVVDLLTGAISPDEDGSGLV